MKISEKEYQFIRANHFLIQTIIGKRKEDYEQSSIYGENVEEREKARLMVQECDYWISLIKRSNNIKNLKEFTGI